MLDIFFISSNRTKIDHAKYLCRNFDINIQRQKQYGIGYLEPRIQDREKLLEKSIRDAINRLKKVTDNFENYFVLIEDTSVIIDALSTSEKEFPGVDVKYWMAATKFEDLDLLLKEKGNNRKVKVRSDLILFLPKTLQVTVGKEFCHYVSYMEGYISKCEFSITTNELYPWLNNRTFNKWFVPKGEKVPLSLLEIERANIYDFRKEAFDEMLVFLESHGLIKSRIQRTFQYKQMNLFNLSLFIICGQTCSGKTTIAEFLTYKFGFYHIEASDFMYLSYYEKHGPFSDVRIGDFAKKALLENPSIVVDQIISHLSKLKKSFTLPIVISGFRDPQEIRSFKTKYLGDLDLIEIFVEANQNLRFIRCIKRGRNDNFKSNEDFRLIDKQQDAMGLGKIRKQIQDENIIINESTINEYYKNFETKYIETLQFLNQNLSSDTVTSLLRTPSKLEHSILISMSKNRYEYLTTTQIAYLINQTFSYKIKKGKDNVSRYFNYKYHPYFEIKIDNKKVKYRLSQTGYSLSQLLLHSYK